MIYFKYRRGVNLENRLSKGPLLDERGNLIEAGYHEDLIRAYDRKDITVKGMRIKEWDYYYVGNHKHGLALTVADNSYMWLVSITAFNFELKIEHTKSLMGFFPMKRIGMPNTSRVGNVVFQKKGFSFEFLIENDKRHLKVFMEKFKDNQSLTADVILTEKENTSLVIATPFDKPGHFYYNHKINLMETVGGYTIGQDTYPLQDAFGTLDWGRGVWTYKNTWYWSSASGTCKEKRIGFNLGYGFGDTSKASENMFYYDGNCYKFEDITFNIPKKNDQYDYLSPWTFTSKSGDIDLVFHPILDRQSASNVIIIKSIQHQVFGKFSGYFRLPDGKKIEFHDLMGFAERVINHW